MRRRLLALAAAAVVVATPAPAPAQTPDAPLERFVEEVARHWSTADVGALVDLISEAERFLLDAGRGTESANSRHAAAALRALFAENETIGTRPVGVTLAGTDPARGFAELTWTFRARGAPGEQSRSVYVAARQEDGSWRLTELRLIP